MNSTDERQTDEGKSTNIVDEIAMEDLGERIPEEETADSNVSTLKPTDTSIQIVFDDTSENATSTNSDQQDSLEDINEIQPEKEEILPIPMGLTKFSSRSNNDAGFSFMRKCKNCSNHGHCTHNIR